jgi:hypothetical protein
MIAVHPSELTIAIMSGWFLGVVVAFALGWRWGVSLSPPS